MAGAPRSRRHCTRSASVRAGRPARGRQSRRGTGEDRRGAGSAAIPPATGRTKAKSRRLERRRRTATSATNSTQGAGEQLYPHGLGLPGPSRVAPPGLLRLAQQRAAGFGGQALQQDAVGRGDGVLRVVGQGVARRLTGHQRPVVDPSGSPGGSRRRPRERQTALRSAPAPSAAAARRRPLPSGKETSTAVCRLIAEPPCGVKDSTRTVACSPSPCTETRRPGRRRRGHRPAHRLGPEALEQRPCRSSRGPTPWASAVQTRARPRPYCHSARIGLVLVAAQHDLGGPLGRGAHVAVQVGEVVRHQPPHRRRRRHQPGLEVVLFLDSSDRPGGPPGS